MHPIVPYCAHRADAGCRAWLRQHCAAARRARLHAKLAWPWHCGHMTEVSLVRASENGEYLILATAEGEEFHLPLTDDLRRTVALTRPRAPVQDDDGKPSSSLTPKEVQQRVRSGLTEHDLAELTGEPVEAFARYAAPVLAERAYIAELARSTRIGRESGAPILADLVTDRLASRGVEPESIVWDAWRELDEPWKVAVDFVVDGRTVRALWVFDHTARAVTAQDEESRWLTETELLDVPIPKRHLSAVRLDDETPLDQSRPAMPETVTGVGDDAAPSATELLLEDLTERRGQRESVEPDDFEDLDEDEVFEGFGPAQRTREAEVGFDHSPSQGRSMPHPAGSARAGAEKEKESAPREPKPARKGRASVPSWDEIVFGAKND